MIQWYKEVVEFAIETGKISASLIQRRFRFGYNRAARLVDLLEARDVVGPQNGSKPREVLIKYNICEIIFILEIWILFNIENRVEIIVINT